MKKITASMEGILFLHKFMGKRGIIPELSKKEIAALETLIEAHKKKN